MRERTKSVLFLDVDGPLIPMRAYHLTKRGSGPLSVWDPCAVGIVTKVLEDTQSRIVVTSTKRLHGMRRFKEEMEQNGMPWLLHQDWCTITDNNVSRPDQIKEWLGRHPEVTAYAVLDDHDMPEFGSRMVAVSCQDGVLFGHMGDMLRALSDHSAG